MLTKLCGNWVTPKGIPISESYFSGSGRKRRFSQFINCYIGHCTNHQNASASFTNCIIENAHKEALRVIKENKEDVILLAKTLIEHEQITAEEIDYLMENRHLKRDEKKEEEQPKVEEPQVEAPAEENK